VLTRYTLLAACFALAALIGSTVACQSQERPPNVVVILTDTLRANYLGVYGYPKETAPFLADLAERAVVFDRAFSTSSWTAPSTSSLFTSLYPSQHGVVEGFMMRRKRNNRLAKQGEETIALNRLPAGVVTLPERFRALGYATFGMASNPIIWDEMGFSRGFDEFRRDLKATADDFVEQVKAWKGRLQQSSPFFLYLHLNDVHGPYEAHEPYYEEQQDWLEDRRARYLSEIGYVDEHIREVYETLNLAEDTILVLLSDHGEEFRDHGGLTHFTSLYVELNRVMMMFHSPPMGLDPKRVDSNVSLIDVLPTLVDLVSGEPVVSAEGVSLAPILRNDEASEALTDQLRRRTLFAHRLPRYNPNPYWGAIWRHWKVIERPDASLEAYDHRSDPIEKRNLYSRDPSQVPARLIAALEEFKTREPVEAPSTIQVEVDEELERTLESLGYVQ
jgi:arylsulfatase A-like enzyme